MKFRAKVYEPMYDFNNKKYIRITIPEHCVDIISKIHNTKRSLLLYDNVDDPLEGKVLKLKVPFRYRRVICDVQGRPVHTLVKGNGFETPPLETTESLEHTLKTENLLGHLLNVHLKLLNILFNVDDRHLVLI